MLRCKRTNCCCQITTLLNGTSRLLRFLVQVVILCSSLTTMIACSKATSETAIQRTATAPFSGEPESAAVNMPTVIPSLFFPQQAPINGERAVDTALLEGQLAMHDNCLRVTGENKEDFLIVWPPDVTVHVNNGVITIHDRAGQEVARVGEQVKLGGGKVASDQSSWLSSQLRLPLPDTCSGPYWLAGEISRD